MKESPDNKQRFDGVGAWSIPEDPTKNVTRLVEVNKEHADEIRALQSLYIQAQISGLSEIVKRVEDVSKLRADHAKEIGTVHQTHDREIHKMEQEKLAALRASDEAARITEANRSLEATKVVERTLSLTAEAQARRYEADMVENNKRIAALEKASYEGAGKGTGAKNLWAIIAMGIGLLVTLFMAALTVGGIVVAIAYAIRQ